MIIARFPFIVPLAVICLMSIVTFFFYWSDKRRAKKNAFRIPERVLLTLSVCFGACGGLLAMLTFRHKTRGEHWYFYAVNIVSILVQGFIVFIVQYYLAIS